VLLESKKGSPVRRAAANHLNKIRAIILDLANEAGLSEPGKFAQAWHMLMKGSIVAAGEGNRNAGREAKKAATPILNGWATTENASGRPATRPHHEAAVSKLGVRSSPVCTDKARGASQAGRRLRPSRNAYLL
jgi:hypothetical protein